MINRNYAYRLLKARGNRYILIMMFAPVIAIAVLMSACGSTGTGQVTGNQTVQPPAVSTPPVTVATVPVTPVTNPAPATQQPAPATQQTTPVQSTTPTQGPSIVPVVAAPALEDLIRTPACDMTITLAEMGEGWLKGNAVPPARSQVISACSVHYYKGSSFSPVVQSTVAVYRSMDAATRAYTNEENAQNTTVTNPLTHPQFGNECFFNNSVPINKLLVFRKANVVVWVWLQNNKTGDIEPYAKIVEQKISK